MREGRPTGARALARAWRAFLPAAIVVLACAACGPGPASPDPSSAATPTLPVPSAPGRVEAVFVHTRPVPPPASTPDLAGIAWPFPGDPATFGQPFTSTLDAWPDGRCALVDAATADAALAGFPSGLLAPVEGSSGWRAGTLGWSARGMDVLLMVGPAGPLSAGTSCGDVWMAQFDPAGG